VSKGTMGKTQNRGFQAWIWAIVINAIIFGVFQFVVLGSVTKADNRRDINDTIADTQTGSESGPGGTFGQLTHIIGDSGTPDEGSNESEAGSEETTAPDDAAADMGETEWQIPEVGDETDTVATVTDIGEPVLEEQTWFHNEFYLDRGEIISLAPRLNPDGSLMKQTVRDGRPKAPVYENIEETFNSEDYVPPRMTPSFFPRADLPDEYRDMDFDIRLRIHLDSRGRVLGTPEIIKGSGYADIDNYVVDKILNDVTFEPARRKDTGEPATVEVVQPIFFE